MTEHSLALVRPPHADPKNTKKRHPLEQLDVSRLARRLTIFRPNTALLDRLLAEAEARIGGLAKPAVAHRVMTHNPDSIWAFARKAKFDPLNPQGDGFEALLLLNEEGLKALASRTLDTSNPDLSLLTRQNERPAGFYVWLTYAPGTLAAAVTLVLERMSLPPYDGVPIFTRATTSDGLRFTEALGFQKGARVYGIDAPHLYYYERSTPKTTNAPLYDSYRSGTAGRTLSVTVARDFNDWLKVASIRSAVYLGEQECPYEEEFDGNDFTAIHLIGYVGDEPAGCIRIRHFADFSKIERMAVRKEFRTTRLSFQLARAAIELCRTKGYRRLYGHAQRRLMNFWSRFGFVPLPGGRELVFSDFDYVEMVLDTEPHPNAITLGTDPYVIIRPEGRWHEPGVLERSAARPVSRPSARDDTP
ncbi:MAG: GNAT family N-acetyltransferase [Alphaproteobacteria bacterium]|nr:GNAT family N-acetyltransferase [Alphaproteobacteria bacterium]MDE2492851.1 GNAT family N-acetyltransferase [Alphaproteobacteria bacterium]